MTKQSHTEMADDGRKSTYGTCKNVDLLCFSAVGAAQIERLYVFSKEAINSFDTSSGSLSA